LTNFCLIYARGRSNTADITKIPDCKIVTGLFRIRAVTIMSTNIAVKNIEIENKRVTINKTQG